ncbi:sugar diacid recognition domain-containing protein [Bacillus infantis]|uniref:sugar diacid recognition domain-containing protein n=1 Tax=Bacillus infantis TaxID=324767 RepID=UPI003CFB591B
MKFLDGALAQEIVDRTMQIIGRNINVMNEKGVIIGSGDEARIQSVHEGAVQVIGAGRGFEITEAEAGRLNGARAGINLPITFQDHIIGVVGITGEPEEIRSYGELVRMAAEMILQQAVLVDEMQWDERLKEELTSQLLSGNEHLDPLYFERVNRLGIDLDIPRTAIVITADEQTKSYKWIRDRLEKEDLYVMNPGYIVLLKKVITKREGWDHAQTMNQAGDWLSGLAASQGLSCQAAIGQYHPGLEGLSRSYREAVHTLEAGRKLDPQQALYFYEDYKLPVFVARAAELGIAGAFQHHAANLNQHDKKGELQETLRIYIEENGDSSSAASRLYIHRNTLRYRLERIKELTGKDPRSIKDLLELYLSLLQNQLR